MSTHATTFGIGLLWCGVESGDKEKRWQVVNVMRDRPLRACGEAPRYGSEIWGDDIRLYAPTCPKCLALYQEALVMRDEHLMQWGEEAP